MAIKRNQQKVNVHVLIAQNTMETTLVQTLIMAPMILLCYVMSDPYMYLYMCFQVF